MMTKKEFFGIRIYNRDGNLECEKEIPELKQYFKWNLYKDLLLCISIVVNVMFILL